LQSHRYISNFLDFFNFLLIFLDLTRNFYISNNIPPLKYHNNQNLANELSPSIEEGGQEVYEKLTDIFKNAANDK